MKSLLIQNLIKSSLKRLKIRSIFLIKILENKIPKNIAFDSTEFKFKQTSLSQQ